MTHANAEFEVWYREFHPRLLATMILVFGDGDAARNATDEAFVRAFQHWRRVRVMDARDAWTITVAKNVIRRHLRRAAQERKAVDRAAAGRSGTVPPPAGEAWALVADLPPRQRMAVVLRHVADLSEPDIATVMGISRGTVSTTLADAYRRMRTWLTPNDEGQVVQ